MPTQPPQPNQAKSEYNQLSFIGGMNLLLDDTHLAVNQYRIGFNLRNRYDELDLILSSVEDTLAPSGIKQEMTTFGDYEILFVSGKAYYKLYTDIYWSQVAGFQMSQTAPRFWTKTVPVSETNYYRLAANPVGQPNSRSGILANNVAGATAGNLPGLLVQDGINQPQFIFLNSSGLPISRVTNDITKWNISFTDALNTVVVYDNREYVPIGTAMEFVDGVLYIVSPSGDLILRSVSGRPLDFVVNVTNLLANVYPFTQYPGGDAYTTAYSVGVGGITCLRAMADNSLFVAASNANFSVSKNMTQNAPTIFGEYTFIRKFLFNANCLSDRAIFDTTGDTRFIDLTGVRSFNSIAQTQNEGRNTVFTSTIQSAFQVVSKTTEAVTNIIQDASYAAGILYNNYELYAVSTVFGPAIAVYDTINSCWTSFDVAQTGGKRIKAFTKIELDVQALFAITEDDRVFRLYAGPNRDVGIVRTAGVCSNTLWLNNNFKMAHPKLEVQLRMTRVIVNKITRDCSISFMPFVGNRAAFSSPVISDISYKEPTNPTTSLFTLSDIDTQMENLLFSTPTCSQGWRVFGLFSWTDGAITQFSMELNNITPMNPLNSR